MCQIQAHQTISSILANLFCIFQAILAVLVILAHLAHNLTSPAHHANNHAIVTKTVTISPFFQETNISHNCLII
jgi:hypothetical protein